jgi:hypothetical protein
MRLGSGSNNRSHSGCWLSWLRWLDDWFCRGNSGLSDSDSLLGLGLSSGLLSRVFKRSDGRLFLNLRWVFIDLGGGRSLGFGLCLEEVTNTGRKTAANFGGLGGLLVLLLFFLLVLLLLLGLLGSDNGLSNRGFSSGLSLFHRLSDDGLLSLSNLSGGSLSRSSLGGRSDLGGRGLFSSSRGNLFLLLLLLLGALGSFRLFLNLALLVLERSEELGKDTRALGAVLLLRLRLDGLILLSSLFGSRSSLSGSVSGGSVGSSNSGRGL